MATSQSSAPIAWEEAGDEAVKLLQALLRIDTRNPPGNENRAAEFLRDVLQRDGIESTIVGPSPDRATIIARLQGDGSEPPLLLMSHTDVVAVEPEKWSHDPFGGEIVDGVIYGRGALDMKNMVAMELMTMLLLKRSGRPLKRDVIFMAAADEEVGGHYGAEWVVKNHPELIRAEYALNEGGGESLELNGRRYYTVMTAEKGTARFRIRAHGTPGHASVPHGDNAIIKLAGLIQRLETRRPPAHFTKTIRSFLTGIASAQPPEVASLLTAILDDEATAYDKLAKLPIGEQVKDGIRSMLSNSIAPTLLSAGSQINVIPSVAEVQFDCRQLPGWSLEQVRAEIEDIFGSDADIEFIDPSISIENDPDSPLFEAIKDIVRQYEPEATVIPTLLPGGTDAKSVSTLGVQVYGFSPELYIPGNNGMDGVHGHNEHFHVAAMHWGTHVLYDVVERMVR